MHPCFHTLTFAVADVADASDAEANDGSIQLEDGAATDAEAETAAAAAMMSDGRFRFMSERQMRDEGEERESTGRQIGHRLLMTCD